MAEPDSSMINSIASIASGAKAEQVQLQLSVAVMKQIQDSQQAAAEGIVEMISQSMPVDPQVGNYVDVTA